MKITVTVPDNMDDEFFEAICSGFKKKYGDDIVIVRRTDPLLIGGFTAEADGVCYDTSVRSKLDKIKEAMKR